MSNKLLAVYGTLKKGFHNHYLLRNAKFMGSIKTEPIFTMYSLGEFPALMKDGNTSIHVEIYKVNENTLQSIYRLEGYSGIRNSNANWYDTIDINTKWGVAEMFYMKNNISGYKTVKNGKWE